MTDLHDRNFKALEGALNILYRDMSDLSERLKRLETSLAQLRGEMAQQQALTAHALGRGTGPTQGN